MLPWLGCRFGRGPYHLDGLCGRKLKLYLFVRCVSTSSIMSIWLSFRICVTSRLCRETSLAIDYLDCLAASSCNTMFWFLTSVCIVVFMNDINSTILWCMVTIIGSRGLCDCTWICWPFPRLDWSGFSVPDRRASAYDQLAAVPKNSSGVVRE